MGFVGLGVLLLVLKLTGLTGVSAWPWWVVLTPFGLAVVWWALADALGYTQAAAMRRQDERAAKRREEQLIQMGVRRPGKRPPRG